MGTIISIVDTIGSEKLAAVVSDNSNLADCYIHLISLASAIYHMSNQNSQFKNHCIEKFNKRWEEFSDNLYLLAFFLHPKYHGKIKIINIYIL